MTDFPGKVENRLSLLKEALHRAGVRVTPQRLEIFREVTGSVDHPDAEAVFQGVRERMPALSLDTVYRTLWLFRDLGLIRTLTPSHDRARFDANLEPHHHVVCTRCGKTRDFLSEEFSGLSIPEDVHSFGTIESTHVEVRGLCRVCARHESASKTSRRNEGNIGKKGGKNV
ncbi:MAG TPA: transcriptional repressor [Thermoanaerobaculia bacterium]|nr:transcriptional repressor [Thermoanaerobaculia bacterium]HUM29656.1 transcriptional repressor [Thermoanaerobaculia bacterium]HXK67307.1 transcriptional repressor [Thermoanaerobaculia bacterium]